LLRFFHALYCPFLFRLEGAFSCCKAIDILRDVRYLRLAKTSSIMNRIVKHLLLMLLASVTLAITIHLFSNNYGYLQRYQERPFSFFFINILVLVAVPLLIGGIPTLIIYLCKKRIWDNFYTIIWVVWIIFGTLFFLQLMFGGS
jgi:hypothetical protein